MRIKRPFYILFLLFCMLHTSAVAPVVYRGSSFNGNGWIAIPQIKHRFRISFSGQSLRDMHIGISKVNGYYYELILGGWNNTHSAARYYQGSGSKIRNLQIFDKDGHKVISNDGGSFTKNGIKIPDTSKLVRYHIDIERNKLTWKYADGGVERILFSTEDTKGSGFGYRSYSFRCHGDMWLKIENVKITYPSQEEGRALIAAFEKEAQQKIANIEKLSSEPAKGTPFLFDSAEVDRFKIELDDFSLNATDIARVDTAVRSVEQAYKNKIALFRLIILVNQVKAGAADLVEKIKTMNLKSTLSEYQFAPGRIEDLLADLTDVGANGVYLDTVKSSRDKVKTHFDIKFKELKGAAILEVQKSVQRVNQVQVKIYQNTATVSEIDNALAYIKSDEFSKEEERLLAILTRFGLADRIALFNSTGSFERSATLYKQKVLSEAHGLFDKLHGAAFGVIETIKKQSNPTRIDAITLANAGHADLLQNTKDAYEKAQLDAAPIAQIETAITVARQQQKNFIAQADEALSKSESLALTISFANIKKMPLAELSTYDEATIKAKIEYDATKKAFEKVNRPLTELDAIYNDLNTDITKLRALREEVAKHWQIFDADLKARIKQADKATTYDEMPALGIKNDHPKLKAAYDELAKFIRDIPEGRIADAKRTNAFINKVSGQSVRWGLEGKKLYQALEAKVTAMRTAIKAADSVDKLPPILPQEDVDAVVSAVNRSDRPKYREYAPLAIALKEEIDKELSETKTAFDKMQAARLAIEQLEKRSADFVAAIESKTETEIAPYTKEYILTYLENKHVKKVLGQATLYPDVIDQYHLRIAEAYDDMTDAIAEQKARIAAVNKVMQQQIAELRERADEYSESFETKSLESLEAITDAQISTTIHSDKVTSIKNFALLSAKNQQVGNDTITSVIASVRETITQRIDTLKQLHSSAADLVQKTKERAQKYREEKISGASKTALDAVTKEVITNVLNIDQTLKTLEESYLPESVLTQYTTTINGLIEEIMQAQQSEYIVLQANANSALSELKARFASSKEWLSSITLEHAKQASSTPLALLKTFDREPFNDALENARDEYEKANKQDDELTVIDNNLTAHYNQREKILAARVLLVSMQAQGDQIISLAENKESTDQLAALFPIDAAKESLATSKEYHVFANLAQQYRDIVNNKTIDISTELTEKELNDEIQRIRTILRNLFTVQAADEALRAAITNALNKLRAITVETTQRISQLTEQTTSKTLTADLLDAAQAQTDSNVAIHAALKAEIETIKNKDGSIAVDTSSIAADHKRMTKAINQGRIFIASQALIALYIQRDELLKLIRGAKNLSNLYALRDGTDAQKIRPLFDEQATLTKKRFAQVRAVLPNNSEYTSQKIDVAVALIASEITNMNARLRKESAGFLLIDLRSFADTILAAIPQKNTLASLNAIKVDNQTGIAALTAKAAQTIKDLEEAVAALKQTGITPTTDQLASLDASHVTKITDAVEKAYQEHEAFITQQNLITKTFTDFKEMIHAFIKDELPTLSIEQIDALKPVDTTNVKAILAGITDKLNAVDELITLRDQAIAHYRNVAIESTKESVTDIAPPPSSSLDEQLKNNTPPSLRTAGITFKWRNEKWSVPAKSFKARFYVNAVEGFALGIRFTDINGKQGHYSLRIGDDDNTTSTIQRRGAHTAWVFGQDNVANSVGVPPKTRADGYTFYQFSIVGTAIHLLAHDPTDNEKPYKTILYAHDKQLPALVDSFDRIDFHKLATQGSFFDVRAVSLAATNKETRRTDGAFGSTDTFVIPNDTTLAPEQPKPTEPAQPETPETPDPVEPELPEVPEPVTPELPKETETPEPTNPELPEVPTEIDLPELPELPEAPDPVEPETPETPEPVTTELPEKAETPEPTSPELPEVPTKIDLPELPELPETPDTVEPETPETPEPVVPELPEEAETPEPTSPGLPEVPTDIDLPGLPELPEAPDPVEPETPETPEPVTTELPEENETSKPVEPKEQEQQKQAENLTWRYLPQDGSTSKKLVIKPNGNVPVELVLKDKHGSTQKLSITIEGLFYTGPDGGAPQLLGSGSDSEEGVEIEVADDVTQAFVITTKEDSYLGNQSLQLFVERFDNGTSIAKIDTGLKVDDPSDDLVLHPLTEFSLTGATQIKESDIGTTVSGPKTKMPSSSQSIISAPVLARTPTAFNALKTYSARATSGRR